MSESLPYIRELGAYRKTGTDNSGWIVMRSGLDIPAQLHLLAGDGRFETTGSDLAAIDADTAVANPVTGDQTAPWSDGLYPVPTAVRFVGTGTWAIQQAATAVRS